MSVKIPPCDAEAARLMELQARPSKGGRLLDRVLVGAFLGVIALFSVLHVALPDRDMSETENRTLTQLELPREIEPILDGSFTAHVAKYLADQFPARDAFITLKTATELARGRGESNGVIFAQNGTLISRNDYPNTENLTVSLTALETFSAYAAEQNIPSTLALTGRSVDVLDHTLPAPYSAEHSDALWAEITARTEDASYAFLNLRDPLRERAAAGEYVYYRTDHHWTSLGAYYGYAAIMEQMGYTPAPLHDFEPMMVTDAFYGTTWSTAGASWIKPDVLEFFRFSNDHQLLSFVKDDESYFMGLYDTSYLLKKDKYSAFLGGNHGLMTVTSEISDAERPVLLFVKDSFAHAAVPFFAKDFDIVIVDMRYYKQAVAPLLETYGVTHVVYLMNTDSLTGSSVLRMLSAGT